MGTNAPPYRHGCCVTLRAERGDGTQFVRDCGFIWKSGATKTKTQSWWRSQVRSKGVRNHGGQSYIRNIRRGDRTDERQEQAGDGETRDPGQAVQAGQARETKDKRVLGKAH